MALKFPVDQLERFYQVRKAAEVVAQFLFEFADKDVALNDLVQMVPTFSDSKIDTGILSKGDTIKVDAMEVKDVIIAEVPIG